MSKQEPGGELRAQPLLPKAHQGLGRFLAWTQGVVTPGGAFLLAVVVFGSSLGLTFGWRELVAPMISAGALILMAAIFLIGRGRLLLDLQIAESRLVAGGTIAASLTVRSRSQLPTFPTRIEVSIGSQRAALYTPFLRARATREVPLLIGAERRGVLDIGPPSRRKSSPIGILSSETKWGGVARVFVYPRTTDLPTVSLGSLTNLEGTSSTRPVSSDFSFHTVREYALGDGFNQIHWKSTAKAHRLMVRQYTESVRSELLVIVDNERGSYLDDEEFELAVSCAASLARRGIVDGRNLTVVAGQQSDRHGLSGQISTLHSFSIRVLLEEFARLEPARAGVTLPALLAASRMKTVDSALVVVVTGSLVSFTELRSAVLSLPPGAPALAVRAAIEEPPGIHFGSGLSILNVEILDDLGHQLSKVVSG